MMCHPENPPIRFAKYLDRSGLTIVRLADGTNLEDTVSFYVKLQQSNPLFISLGSVWKQLQKYTKIVIATSVKFPFNILVITVPNPDSHPL